MPLNHQDTKFHQNSIPDGVLFKSPIQTELLPQPSFLTDPPAGGEDQESPRFGLYFKLGDSCFRRNDEPGRTVVFIMSF
jgi:hypothetical protein